MFRSLIVLACALLAAPLFAQTGGAATSPAEAQKTVTLAFGSDGERMVWERSRPSPEEAKTAGVEVTGTQMEIALKPGTVVGVWDKATGKVAEKSSDEVRRTGKWTLAPSDFRRIYQVDVQVVHDLKPVSSAVVVLKAGSESRESLLTPEAKGTVSFINVPAGPYEARVKYKFDGTDKVTPVQTFTPAPQGGKPAAILISIADAVATVSPEKAQGKEGGSEPAGGGQGAAAPVKPAGGSPWGTFVSILLGLAIVGGLGYVGYLYFKKQPELAKDLAKKAGLDPDTADRVGQPGAVVQAPQPKPLQPIVLAGSDPGPSSGGPGPGLAAAGLTGAAGASAARPSPRLVLEDGAVFPLAEGEHTVGRDAAASIALAGQTGVSRLHATVRVAGGEAFISDSGSTNGTYVNGIKLSGESRLIPGDQIVFGGAKARFEG